MFTEEGGWQSFRTDQDAFGHFSICGRRDRLEIAAYIDGTLCQLRCPAPDIYESEVRRLCDYAGAVLLADLPDPEDECLREAKGFRSRRDGPGR